MNSRPIDPTYRLASCGRDLLLSSYFDLEDGDYYLHWYRSETLDGVGTCGYPDSSNPSTGVAWCNAGKDFPNPQGPVGIWAQAGVGWQRSVPTHGDNEIWEFMYTEEFAGWPTI